jgi:thiol-disulfide isomerase/thioredoxin
MKTTPFLLFVILLVTFYSCKNGTNQKTNDFQQLAAVRNKDLDTLPVKQLYHKFLKNQNRINIITYNVQRIDTPDQGSIWNNCGKATLERNKNDTIFKFSFYGKRNDLSRLNYYIENRHFQVYPETKSYKIETNYGSHVLGAPGGQMVIVDLLNTDTISGNLSIKNKDDESFIIKTVKISDSYTVTKTVTIDKVTLIPLNVFVKVTNPVLNYKQSTTYFISNVLLNDQVKNNELANLDFLSTFTQEVESEDKSADTLIGKKVPEILLVSLANDTINLRTFESKIVLLDFWEIWCGPCLHSLPKIQAISKTYGSRGLVIFGIVTDNLEKAKKHIEKEGLNFKQVKGDGKLKSIFSVKSVPRYVLVDRSGIVRNIYYGYSDNIEKDIKSLISN